MKKRSVLTLRSEEGDEGNGDRLLLVRRLTGQLVESKLHVGNVEAVFNPHQHAFDPLVLIGEGAFIQMCCDSAGLEAVCASSKYSTAKAMAFLALAWT